MKKEKCKNIAFRMLKIPVGHFVSFAGMAGPARMTPSAEMGPLYKRIVCPFLGALLLLSCNINSPPELRGERPSDGEEEVDEQGVVLPEPSVGEPARFKLTELSATPHKILQLKDKIDFHNLKGIPVNDITMAVTSHCLIDTKDVIIKEYQRPLSSSLSLIEILPQEILLHQGLKNPSCGFSFKAKNSSGSAHHFELPQLPIENYRESHSLSIKQGQKALDVPYSNVFISQLSEYSLNKGVDSPIQQLDLICDDFSFSLDILSQEQFVPLSAFPFEYMRRRVRESILKNKPVQVCRILGYAKSDKTEELSLTGISAFFKLIYPKQDLLVSIEPSHDKFESKGSDVFFTKMSEYSKRSIHYSKQTSTGEKKSLYSVTISNYRSYPVPILIRKIEEEEIKNMSYTVYFVREGDWGSYSYYYPSHFQYSIEPMEIINGDLTKTSKEGDIVVLNPSGHLRFHIYVSKAPEICQLNQASSLDIREFRWLGTLFEYLELNLFELADFNDIKNIPLEGNIVQKINTTRFQDSSHLTLFSKDNITHNPNMKLTEIPFQESRCFKDPDPDYDFYLKPFITFSHSMDGASRTYGSWKAQWSEPRPRRKREEGYHARLKRSFTD